MSIVLSPDQQIVYDKLYRYLKSPADNKEFRLGGLAGTGKSTLLSKFVQENSGLGQVAAATFTGKAAERLLQTNLARYAKVSTLHKLLYEPRFDEDTKEFLGFELRETIEPIVFIDEASMVPREFYEILMNFLNNPSGGLKKLVFVGDHGQLPPVEVSKEVGAEPFNVVSEHLLDAKLEKIHRQAEGSPIIKLAHAIRNCISINEVKEVVRTSGINVVTEEDAVRGCLHYGRQDSWHNVVNIVFRNQTRCRVNDKFVQQYSTKVGLPVIGLQNKSRKRDGSDKIVKGSSFGIPVSTGMPGSDTVFIANGSRGLLQEEPRLGVSTKDVRVQVVFLKAVEFNGIGIVQNIETWPNAWGNDKAQITYNRRFQEILYIDWAFAITCHKSQGSSWKVVLVWLSDLGSIRDVEFLKKWLYTAVTRAEERLAFVV